MKKSREMVEGEKTLEWIVSEVVRRLSELTQRPTSSAAAPSEPVVQTLAIRETPVSSPPAVMLHQTVISVATLSALAKQPAAVVSIARHAIVTPAALDWLRDKGWQLERRGITSSPLKPVSLQRSVSSPTTVDASSTSTASGSATRSAVSTSAAGLEIYWICDAATHPRCRWLQTSAAQRFRLTTVSSWAAVSSGAVSAGVWVTTQAAAALCQANQTAGHQAIWGLDRRAVEEGCQQVAANWLIVDPERVVVADWLRMLSHFGQHARRPGVTAAGSQV